ncbi:DUF4436 family protein [Antrihabitans sp. YC3-6]|uniref:DUF4436 family protein n=1 Tax=Antrihabitans stalagmiti TaxID=2799499 RepID=A0A934U0Z2_9NOCA|nr:DUF4436 family protein [Antrihabitans stalagmiti]MBJ8337757.1 DUF4436 family protein [Antrihabitans stalagmiti]
MPERGPFVRRFRVPLIAVSLIAVYCAVLFASAFDVAFGTQRQLSIDAARESTVVDVVVQQIQPEVQSIAVTVTLVPGFELLDDRGRLRDAVVVALNPDTTPGDIVFPAGHHPSTLSTNMATDGDLAAWPFDRYVSERLTVDVWSETATGREPIAASARISNTIYGWDVTQTATTDSAVTTGFRYKITLARAPSTLAYDIMLVSILVALPALGLFVAINTVRGRRPFLAPLTGWFAIMLFAEVQLRNALPGAPPPGSWIDRSVTIWALIGLVAAMTMYVVAWWRDHESQTM